MPQFDTRFDLDTILGQAPFPRNWASFLLKGSTSPGHHVPIRALPRPPLKDSDLLVSCWTAAVAWVRPRRINALHIKVPEGDSEAVKISGGEGEISGRSMMAEEGSIDLDLGQPGAWEGRAAAPAEL
jgi:hypothetical protein